MVVAGGTHLLAASFPVRVVELGKRPCAGVHVARWDVGPMGVSMGRAKWRAGGQTLQSSRGTPATCPVAISATQDREGTGGTRALLTRAESRLPSPGDGPISVDPEWLRVHF